MRPCPRRRCTATSTRAGCDASTTARTHAPEDRDTEEVPWRPLLSALVALTVLPLVAIGALRVVAQPWIVHFEVDHGRLPADRYGFTDGDRRRLGLLGLEAITPGGAGVAVLREARLEDGSPAFGSRELRHMEDVRALVGGAFRLHTWLLVAVVALGVALAWPASTRAVVPRGLRWGAIVTLAAAVTVSALMLAAWDTFFTWFHRLFFSGWSWWFYSDDTLRRVYPDAFWMGVGGWIAGLTVTFTVAVLGASHLWLRRARSPAQAGAGAGATGGEWDSAA